MLWLKSKNYAQSLRSQPHLRPQYPRFAHVTDRALQVDAVRSYEALKEDLSADLSRHLLDMQRGAITSGQFASRMKAVLRPAYERAFKLGMEASGWTGSVEQQDKNWIQSWKASEWGFLNRWSNQLDSGEYRMNPAQRLGLYLNSVDGIYWAGRLAATDDMTRIYWRITESAEHCPECLAVAAGNPYTKKTLPFQPRSGFSYTSCGPMCACFLEFAPPAGYFDAAHYAAQGGQAERREEKSMLRHFLVRSDDLRKGGIFPAVLKPQRLLVLLKSRRVKGYYRVDPRTGQKVFVPEHTDPRDAAQMELFTKPTQLTRPQEESTVGPSSANKETKMDEKKYPTVNQYEDEERETLRQQEKKHAQEPATSESRPATVTRGTKVAALMTKEEAEKIGLRYYPAQREDIQVDNGQGGYRTARKEEQGGKVIAVGYSKELRSRGIARLPGQQAYVPESMAGGFVEPSPALHEQHAAEPLEEGRGSAQPPSQEKKLKDQDASGKPGRKISRGTQGNYLVSFPYDADLVAAIKQIPGRKFRPSAKDWLVPAEQREALAAFAEKHGFGAVPEAKESAA